MEAYRRGDRAGALFQFQALAREGVTGAFVSIGGLYEFGGGGVKRDYAKARKWYSRAAHELADVEAYLRLGRLYYLGRGVPRDFSRARECYSVTIPNRKAVAFLVLGHMYRYGHGVRRDVNVARDYYERASGLGNLVAEKAVAEMDIMAGRYFVGAMKWLRSAWRIFLVAVKDRDDERLRSA